MGCVIFNVSGRMMASSQIGKCEGFAAIFFSRNGVSGIKHWHYSSFLSTTTLLDAEFKYINNISKGYRREVKYIPQYEYL